MTGRCKARPWPQRRYLSSDAEFYTFRRQVARLEEDGGRFAPTWPPSRAQLSRRAFKKPLRRADMTSCSYLRSSIRAPAPAGRLRHSLPLCPIAKPSSLSMAITGSWCAWLLALRNAVIQKPASNDRAGGFSRSLAAGKFNALSLGEVAT